MADASAGLLLDTMEKLEDELELLRNDWADAEERMIRVGAQVARAQAKRWIAVKSTPPAKIPKPTKEDLQALMLDWLWSEHEDLMVAQIDADACAIRCKTVYNVASKALSSKQSRLKAEIETMIRSGR